MTQKATKRLINKANGSRGANPQELVRLPVPFSWPKLNRISGIFKTFLVALTLGLVACEPPLDTTIQSAPDASLILTPCTKDQFSHRGTRKDFQCGQLSVAENPNELEGSQVSLNIVRLPALSSSPKTDPVFVLAGGPGQGSTEIVAGVGPWVRAISRERDIIFVDQRGTGKSNPLDCESTSDEDLLLSVEDRRQTQLRFFRSCLENYDADLRFYTTPYAADDIHAVAEALGYEKYNLWGASYGTRLALEIMRRHSESVRAAVLDGVAPVGIHLPEFMLEDADRALQIIIDQCDMQAACAQQFPQLATQIRQLVRDYDEEPRTVTITHPLRGEPLSLHLDGQMIAGLLRLGLYSRELAPTIPLMIDSAAKDNFSPLLTLFSLGEDLEQGMSVGLQQTILCVEDVARIDGDKPIDATSLLQIRAINDAKAICEFWPKGELPDNFFEPVKSDIPTLMLSGQLDPVTPPRWGDFAAEHLTQHIHVRVDGAHHNVSNLGCVPDLIDEFFTNTATENLDTSCAGSIQPLPPFTSAAGPWMASEKQAPENSDDEASQSKEDEL